MTRGQQLPTLTGMNRRPRIAVIAFGQAPVGLIYELEKRGVDVTKGEIADVEELVESQDPHLIALSGIRGAMELSTLLEDQDRAASPRVAVIAARRDLSRLWGLNRDVVISLLATEMGDKVVAGRLDALARQAAKKRGEALEPAAGASGSLEPRLVSDAQTTLAPQAVAAIQLVKQAQKQERAAAAASEPKRPTDDVAELDSELLESDRPPNPEAPLPSVLMTKLGIGLPEDLRSLSAQKAKQFPAPPEAELTKSSAPTDPPPDSLPLRDSTWDMEVTAQYESVTARPPAGSSGTEATSSKDDARSAEGRPESKAAALPPHEGAELGPRGAPLTPIAGESVPAAPSSPIESEPFAPAKSSPIASEPFAASKSTPNRSGSDDGDMPPLDAELALEKLQAAGNEESSALPSKEDRTESASETTVTLTDSLPPGDVASEPPLPDEKQESLKASARPLNELLPHRKPGDLRPNPGAAPPGKKTSPVAGIVLVLLGGLGAAYLVSVASGPEKSEPSQEAISSKVSETEDSLGSAEDAPAPTPETGEPAAEVPAEPSATNSAKPSQPKAPEPEVAPPSDAAAPTLPTGAAGRGALARALTVNTSKVQTCTDLVPTPPTIGPDPAAQASPPWNAARKAIVKGDLVAAKAGMCEAALINPTSPALEALALLFVTEDAPNEALTWLDKAEAVRPGTRETLDLRAVALTQLGRLDEARDVWFRALNLTAEDTGRRQGNAVEDINVGKQHLKRGDLPRAERLLRRAVVLAPENSVGLATLAEVLARKKAYDQATILADAAIAQEAYLPDAYVTLAEIARAQGNVEKARTDLERALKIRPDLWAAKKLLSEIDKAGK